MKHLALVAWACGCTAYLIIIPMLNKSLVTQKRLQQNRAVLKQAENKLLGTCSWNDKTLPLDEAWEALLEHNRRLK